jgi:hypothetical protein
MANNNVPLDIQMIQDKLKIECRGDRNALPGSDAQRLAAWESVRKRDAALAQRAEVEAVRATIPARMQEEAARTIAKLRRQPDGIPRLEAFKVDLQTRMAHREAMADLKRRRIEDLRKRQAAELARATHDMDAFKADKGAVPAILAMVDAVLVELRDPLVCPGCGKRFRSQSTLDKHAITCGVPQQ